MNKEKANRLMIFMIAIALLWVGAINFVLIGTDAPIRIPGLEWLLVVGGALPILYDIWQRRKSGKRQVWEKKPIEGENKP